MRADGTGRSNGLPVLQIVLGGALAAVGLADLVVRRDVLALVFVLGGFAQLVAGIVGYRRNQRLDREEDEARPRPVAQERR